MKDLEKRMSKLEAAYGVKSEDGLLTWPEIRDRAQSWEETVELATNHGDADAKFRATRQSRPCSAPSRGSHHRATMRPDVSDTGSDCA